jgi:hypothetical protein
VTRTAVSAIALAVRAVHRPALAGASIAALISGVAHVPARGSRSRWPPICRSAS